MKKSNRRVDLFYTLFIMRNFTFFIWFILMVLALITSLFERGFRFLYVYI